MKFNSNACTNQLIVSHIIPNIWNDRSKTDISIRINTVFVAIAEAIIALHQPFISERFQCFPLCVTIYTSSEIISVFYASGLIYSMSGCASIVNVLVAAIPMTQLVRNILKIHKIDYWVSYSFHTYWRTHFHLIFNERTVDYLTATDWVSFANFSLHVAERIVVATEIFGEFIIRTCSPTWMLAVQIDFVIDVATDKICYFFWVACVVKFQFILLLDVLTVYRSTSSALGAWKIGHTPFLIFLFWNALNRWPFRNGCTFVIKGFTYFRGHGKKLQSSTGTSTAPLYFCKRGVCH